MFREAVRKDFPEAQGKTRQSFLRDMSWWLKMCLMSLDKEKTIFRCLWPAKGTTTDADEVDDENAAHEMDAPFATAAVNDAADANDANDANDAADDNDADANEANAQGGPNTKSQRVTREERPAPASDKTTGVGHDPAVRTGSQHKRVRLLGDANAANDANATEANAANAANDANAANVAPVTTAADAVDADKLAEELHRQAPAIKIGAQGRPNPAGEGQAGPRQEQRIGREKTRKVNREKRPAPASDKPTGVGPDPAVITGSQGKGKVRVLGDQKLDLPESRSKIPTWRELNENGIKRWCWVCNMEFKNKQIMYKHFIAGNNDCAPPLGAPSEMRIKKRKAKEKRQKQNKGQQKKEDIDKEIEDELKQLEMHELRNIVPELFEPEELIEQVKYNII